MTAENAVTLSEALNQYMSTLRDSQKRGGQQEISRFVLWCGRERSTGRLTPPEVEEYAGRLAAWGADAADRLKPVRSFLTYLNGRGLSQMNLAPHLRVSRAKGARRRVFVKTPAEKAELSAEGMADLESRLETLRLERTKVVADIGRAMADKDFKENSPLDAAKERQGFIESNIRELESVLANAVLAIERSNVVRQRAKVGSQVTLRDVASGKKLSYKLVDAREANPQVGRISTISPVGKALLDRAAGEEVRVTAPKGTLNYVVEEVKG